MLSLRRTILVCCLLVLTAAPAFGSEESKSPVEPKAINEANPLDEVFSDIDNKEAKVAVKANAETAKVDQKQSNDKPNGHNVPRYLAQVWSLGSSCA
jgi:hypothetical protein